MVNLEAFLSDGFVASVLRPEPVDFAEMGRIVDEASAHRPVVHATDVDCGRTPRFMAQVPVMLTTPVHAHLVLAARVRVRGLNCGRHRLVWED